MTSSSSTDETAVSALYHALLAAWNRRSAADYAALFDEQANVIGFDGSQMDGRAAIESELERIFKDHPTAAYLGKIRGVRFLTPDVVLLRAVAGMRSPGQTDLTPAVNAIHTLLALKQPDGWRIVLFQNTPAQFHGRPELSEALANELRALIGEGDTGVGLA